VDDKTKPLQLKTATPIDPYETRITDGKEEN
jgi:hypothetical protein